MSNESNVPAIEERAGLGDLVGFLFGRQRSIEKLLRCSGVLWFAGFMVFTAAMAREYDAVSLLHRPWDLLGPFGASLVLCSVIFLFVKICLAISRQGAEDFVQEYKVFLSGYWLTAPLAWLYAFPVELLGDEITSLHFNLTALSIVSLWRVLLFSRVISVVYRIPIWCSLAWVLVPCMVIAFYFLMSAILPMVSIMGGIRMTRSQAVLFSFQNSVSGIIFFGALPVFVLALSALSYLRFSSRLNESSAFKQTYELKRSIWVMPMAVLVVLIIGSGYFQPRLWLAERVNKLLNQQRFAEAIKIMEAHVRQDFPEAWDPPPTFSRRPKIQPEVAELLIVLNERKPATWINDLLLNQADEIIFAQFGWTQGTASINYLTNMLRYERDVDEMERIADNLKLLAEIPRSNPEDVQRARLLEDAVRSAITEQQKEDSAASGEKPLVD